VLNDRGLAWCAEVHAIAAVSRRAIQNWRCRPSTADVETSHSITKLMDVFIGGTEQYVTDKPCRFPAGFPSRVPYCAVWDSNSQHFSRGWSGRFFAPVTTIPRYPQISSPGIERRPAANLRALLPRDDQYRRFSNPGGIAAPRFEMVSHLPRRADQRGPKFENGVLVERPNKSASADTHAA